MLGQNFPRIKIPGPIPDVFSDSQGSGSSDLRIVCQDGILQSHQFILERNSDFLKKLFEQQMTLVKAEFMPGDPGLGIKPHIGPTYKRCESVQMSLPDYSKREVQQLLELLCRGETSKLNRHLDERKEDRKYKCVHLLEELGIKDKGDTKMLVRVNIPAVPDLAKDGLKDLVVSQSSVHQSKVLEPKTKVLEIPPLINIKGQSSVNKAKVLETPPPVKSTGQSSVNKTQVLDPITEVLEVPPLVKNQGQSSLNKTKVFEIPPLVKSTTMCQSSVNKTKVLEASPCVKSPAMSGSSPPLITLDASPLKIDHDKSPVLQEVEDISNCDHVQKDISDTNLILEESMESILEECATDVIPESPLGSGVVSQEVTKSNSILKEFDSCPVLEVSLVQTESPKKGSHSTSINFEGANLITPNIFSPVQDTHSEKQVTLHSMQDDMLFTQDVEKDTISSTKNQDTPLIVQDALFSTPKLKKNSHHPQQDIAHPRQDLSDGLKSKVQDTHTPEIDEIQIVHDTCPPAKYDRIVHDTRPPAKDDLPTKQDINSPMQDDADSTLQDNADSTMQVSDSPMRDGADFPMQDDAAVQLFNSAMQVPDYSMQVSDSPMQVDSPLEDVLHTHPSVQDSDALESHSWSPESYSPSPEPGYPAFLDFSPSKDCHNTGQDLESLPTPSQLLSFIPSPQCTRSEQDIQCGTRSWSTEDTKTSPQGSPSKQDSKPSPQGSPSKQDSQSAEKTRQSLSPNDPLYDIARKFSKRKKYSQTVSIEPHDPLKDEKLKPKNSYVKLGKGDVASYFAPTSNSDADISKNEVFDISSLIDSEDENEILRETESSPFRRHSMTRDEPSSPLFKMKDHAKLKGITAIEGTSQAQNQILSDEEDIDSWSLNNESVEDLKMNDFLERGPSPKNVKNSDKKNKRRPEKKESSRRKRQQSIDDKELKTKKQKMDNSWKTANPLQVKNVVFKCPFNNCNFQESLDVSSHPREHPREYFEVKHFIKMHIASLYKNIGPQTLYQCTTSGCTYQNKSKTSFLAHRAFSHLELVKMVNSSRKTIASDDKMVMVYNTITGYLGTFWDDWLNQLMALEKSDDKNYQVVLKTSDDENELMAPKKVEKVDTMAIKEEDFSNKNENLKAKGGKLVEGILAQTSKLPPKADAWVTKEETPPPGSGEALVPVNGECHPPTQPPANRPGRNTNKLQYLKLTVMKAVWKHQDCRPFKTPVNAVKLNIPDYHKIIEHPMDLGCIKKRLENNYYWSSEECIKDFETVFNNCFLYNKAESEIVVMAQALETFYQTKIESMPKEEVEIVPSPKEVKPKTIKKVKTEPKVESAPSDEDDVFNKTKDNINEKNIEPKKQLKDKGSNEMSREAESVPEMVQPEDDVLKILPGKTNEKIKELKKQVSNKSCTKMSQKSTVELADNLGQGEPIESGVLVNALSKPTIKVNLKHKKQDNNKGCDKKAKLDILEETQQSDEIKNEQNNKGCYKMSTMSKKVKTDILDEPLQCDSSNKTKDKIHENVKEPKKQPTNKGSDKISHKVKKVSEFSRLFGETDPLVPKITSKKSEGNLNLKKSDDVKLDAACSSQVSDIEVAKEYSSYVCKLCSYVYKSDQALLDHIVENHSDDYEKIRQLESGEKFYECIGTEQCKKKFSFLKKEVYSQHLFKDHGKLTMILIKNIKNWSADGLISKLDFCNPAEEALKNDTFFENKVSGILSLDLRKKTNRKSIFRTSSPQNIENSLQNLVHKKDSISGREKLKKKTSSSMSRRKPSVPTKPPVVDTPDSPESPLTDHWVNSDDETDVQPSTNTTRLPEKRDSTHKEFEEIVLDDSEEESVPGLYPDMLASSGRESTKKKTSSSNSRRKPTNPHSIETDHEPNTTEESLSSIQQKQASPERDIEEIFLGDSDDEVVPEPVSHTCPEVTEAVVEELESCEICEFPFTSSQNGSVHFYSEHLEALDEMWKDFIGTEEGKNNCQLCQHEEEQNNKNVIKLHIFNDHSDEFVQKVTSTGHFSSSMLQLLLVKLPAELVNNIEETSDPVNNLKETEETSELINFLEENVLAEDIENVDEIEEMVKPDDIEIHSEDGSKETTSTCNDNTNAETCLVEDQDKNTETCLAEDDNADTIVLNYNDDVDSIADEIDVDSITNKLSHHKSSILHTPNDEFRSENSEDNSAGEASSGKKKINNIVKLGEVEINLAEERQISDHTEVIEESSPKIEKGVSNPLFTPVSSEDEGNLDGEDETKDEGNSNGEEETKEEGNSDGEDVTNSGLIRCESKYWPLKGCTFETNNAKELIDHMLGCRDINRRRNHENKESRKIPCPACGNKYINLNMLETHVRDIHTNESRPDKRCPTSIKEDGEIVEEGNKIKDKELEWQKIDEEKWQKIDEERQKFMKESEEENEKISNSKRKPQMQQKEELNYASEKGYQIMANRDRQFREAKRRNSQEIYKTIGSRRDKPGQFKDENESWDDNLSDHSSSSIKSHSRAQRTPHVSQYSSPNHVQQTHHSKIHENSSQNFPSSSGHQRGFQEGRQFHNEPNTSRTPSNDRNRGTVKRNWQQSHQIYPSMESFGGRSGSGSRGRSRSREDREEFRTESMVAPKKRGSQEEELRTVRMVPSKSRDREELVRPRRRPAVACPRCDGDKLAAHSRNCQNC